MGSFSACKMPKRYLLNFKIFVGVLGQINRTLRCKVLLAFLYENALYRRQEAIFFD